MKTPRVIFRRGALSEILDRTGLAGASDVENMVVEAVRDAEALARKGLREFDKTLAPPTRRAKKRAWRADSEVVRFFGRSPLTVAAMRGTRRRMRRVARRLEQRRLKVRLLPQPRGSSSTTNGHNHGSFLSPMRFVLFPAWFGRAERQRAAIVVHELLHDWHVDHKVRDGGRRRTAYGERLAALLARKRPRAARRNPENFEQFCLAVWGRP